jgi:5'-nucleotidase
MEERRAPVTCHALPVTSRNMRILITNDDGINAPGLTVLQEIARELSQDVWTVAPELDQSGAAHSLTLREPIRMREVAERVFAVRGTPTDCIIMGVRHVLKDERPDLVLSGVNRGSNLAEDVTYSGTIAGALEGTLLGIRAIALSQSGALAGPGKIRWHTARVHGPKLIAKLLRHDWLPGVLMNVNFPDCEPADVAGIAVTVQGRRDQDLLVIDERQDTWGSPYFWFGYERRRSNPQQAAGARPHTPAELRAAGARARGRRVVAPTRRSGIGAPTPSCPKRAAVPTQSVNRKWSLGSASWPRASAAGKCGRERRGSQQNEARGSAALTLS